MTSTRRETVLVVDDDRGVVGVVRRVLEMSGYRVLIATDPAEALELSLCYGHTIDLLFTDVHMPHLSGPALAARLRRARPRMPVLYSTSDPEDPVLDGAERSAGAAFLAKPYSPDQLLSAIRAVLELPA